MANPLSRRRRAVPAPPPPVEPQNTYRPWSPPKGPTESEDEMRAEGQRALASIKVPPPLPMPSIHIMPGGR